MNKMMTYLRTRAAPILVTMYIYLYETLQLFRPTKIHKHAEVFLWSANNERFTHVWIYKQ